MAEFENLVRMVDWLGVALGAAGGVLAAAKKQMDWIGALVVAGSTAVGGGTIRDLLLGRVPVFWISDATYLYVIFITATIVYLSVRSFKQLERLLVWADAFALGVFAITGARIAMFHSQDLVVIIFLGCITGAAGGIIRDVLCNEIPMVFQSGPLYVTAAIAGLLLFCLLDRMGMPLRFAGMAGAALIITIRLAAIEFRLKLPPMNA